MRPHLGGFAAPICLGGSPLKSSVVSGHDHQIVPLLDHGSPRWEQPNLVATDESDRCRPSSEVRRITESPTSQSRFPHYLNRRRGTEQGLKDLDRARLLGHLEGQARQQLLQ